MVSNKLVSVIWQPFYSLSPFSTLKLLIHGIYAKL